MDDQDLLHANLPKPKTHFMNIVIFKTLSIFHILPIGQEFRTTRRNLEPKMSTHNSSQKNCKILNCVPGTLLGLSFALCAQHNTAHSVQYKGNKPRALEGSQGHWNFGRELCLCGMDMVLFSQL